MGRSYFIGVDVGTSSVRASVIDEAGNICSSQAQTINIWNPCTDLYQQSSNDIWEAVVCTIKKVIHEALVLPENVKGIGFDATCSMVVLDEDLQPISVSPNDGLGIGTNAENCNIITQNYFHSLDSKLTVVNSLGQGSIFHKVLKHWDLYVVAQNKCGLQGKFKIWCLQFMLIPKLLWPLIVYDICSSTVEAIEAEINKYTRKWLGVPPGLSDVAMYWSINEAKPDYSPCWRNQMIPWSKPSSHL
ncbi:ribulokinase [Plakobranchus ocellatus]|uniref:Ribulokinase n=1 Tax=Plakobranchus ocellatus TaxID=259542 RepID=A0AAV4D746_9GAST|nr:ribulokinase [Plakobranchus ocellatus]